MPVLRTAARLVPLLLLVTACRSPDPLRTVPPSAIGPVVPFSNAALREASGIAPARRAGHAWLIEDSGNPPELVAVDLASGTVQQRVRLRGARNRDWEAVAAGPCPDATARCLVVGDVGDNQSRREFVTLYRTREPAADAAEAEAERLDLVLEGGPTDIEALTVDSAGTVRLLSKGRDQPPFRLYEVPPAAWARHGCPAAAERPCARPDTAHLRQTLALPMQGFHQLITDAALRPDGAELAVRTYGALLLLRVQGDGTLQLSGGIRCRLTDLQAQGEGVAWLADRRLVLATEATRQAPASLRTVACPPPGRGPIARRLSDDG